MSFIQRPHAMFAGFHFGSITRFAIALVACISLLAIAGCGKKDATDANATGDSSANDDGGGGGEGNSDDADDDGPVSEDSFNSMKSMLDMQVQGVEAQAQTLRQMLVEWPDDGMKAEIDKLDAKIADLRQTCDGAKYPAGVKTMRDDVPKKLGEAMEMVAATTTRMQETIRAKTGGGGGAGGG